MIYIHPSTTKTWSLIVPANDPVVLNNTLLRSPAIDEHCEVIVKRAHACASAAFNEAIHQAQGDILVFAHQDVYLPAEWKQNLDRAILRLEQLDPHWGVIGPVGVASDHEIRGHVYSTGLDDYVGEAFSEPWEAVTLDELVLVLRRSSGLRFDEELPGFHLYGADICIEARRRGFHSYIVPAFCLHNSNGVARLPHEFWQAYLHLRRKWHDQLPIQTCCTLITRGCWPMLRKGARDLVRASLGTGRVGTRTNNPSQLYKQLQAEGFERLKVA